MVNFVGSKQPAPRVTSNNAAFFSSLRDGCFKLQRCPRCGEVIYYPRVVCPHCLYTGKLEWVPVSGLGTIYSFAVVHRPQHPSFFKDVPIILVAIRLDEGPIMISSMVGCSPEDVRIGMRVAVTTYPSTDIVIPRFVPYSGRATVGVPRAVTSGQEEPSST